MHELSPDSASSRRGGGCVRRCGWALSFVLVATHVLVAQSMGQSTPTVKPTVDVATSDLPARLRSIESDLNSLRRFTLQISLGIPGETEEIQYQERVPSRVAIDPDGCMLHYLDGSGHEPAWSLRDLRDAEVKTDVEFHDEIAQHDGEERREISASPSTYMVKVTLKSAAGWPMHAWGVPDRAVAERIAGAMRSVSKSCAAGSGISAPGHRLTQ
jgi:hypothetical protein